MHEALGQILSTMMQTHTQTCTQMKPSLRPPTQGLTRSIHLWLVGWVLLGSMTIRVQSRLLLLPEEVGQPAPRIPDLTNALVRIETVVAGGDSPGKGVCCPVLWPEFNPWSSHGERRNLTPCHPLTHTCVPHKINNCPRLTALVLGHGHPH